MHVGLTAGFSVFDNLVPAFDLPSHTFFIPMPLWQNFATTFISAEAFSSKVLSDFKSPTKWVFFFTFQLFLSPISVHPGIYEAIC